MSSHKYAAPSVRQLAAVVEKVAPRDPAKWDGREKAPGAGGVLVQVSEQRAKQLWMVVGMYARAVDRSDDGRFPTRSAADLFRPEPLSRFWALAIGGGLRHFNKHLGEPLPTSSRLVVRDCLKILARLVAPGQGVDLPMLEESELKPPVPGRQLTALYRELVDLAGSGPLQRGEMGIREQERARLLAMVSVVLDTGSRVGELARMNLTDLAEDLSWVRVVRSGQNWREVNGEEVAYRLGVSRVTVSRVLGGEPHPLVSEALRQEVLREAEVFRAEGVVERYALSHGSRVAVGRWLDVRSNLTAGLEGGVQGGKSALWVTVFPSKAGPAGIRIRAQGLGQSYARGVNVLNWLMAGRPGWEPLPVRLEQLRRAVDPVPLEDEAGQ